MKHLPLDEWPQADHAAFATAYVPGDVFDDSRGPGAHLAEGTRRMIRTSWRRWLGFLCEHAASELRRPPADRITPERVRAFVEHLAGQVTPSGVAINIDALCHAAGLIAPDRDWAWLRALSRRLCARAQPQDRFDRLVPGWLTLDYGIALMDQALTLAVTSRKAREIHYRDGLLLALLSCWPIRRRSIAALTVNRHIETIGDHITFVLHPEDTKSKRVESIQICEQLLPYVQRYLKEVRPRLLGRKAHDALWVSYRGSPLAEGRIYDIVRRRTRDRFGKAMGLHDFRRAAATFVALETPEQVGLIPGILQHASPEVGEMHYNLARGVQASRRFGAHLEQTRHALRAHVPIDKD